MSGEGADGGGVTLIDVTALDVGNPE